MNRLKFRVKTTSVKTFCRSPYPKQADITMLLCQTLKVYKTENSASTKTIRTIYIETRQFEN